MTRLLARTLFAAQSIQPKRRNPGARNSRRRDKLVGKGFGKLIAGSILVYIFLKHYDPSGPDLEGLPYHYEKIH